MSESIRNPAVYRNINRLRDLIADAHFKGDTVSVLIDCETGEFTIPQAIGDLEPRMRQSRKTSSHPFKHGTLQIHTKSGQVSFQWVDADWQHSLSEAAISLLHETLAAINHCGQLSASANPKEVLFDCVRSLKWEMPDEITSQSAWLGDLERIPAEKLLSKAPPGSYLLRKGDAYTRLLEGNLAAQDALPVRCFVLTLADSSSKISDKILVQRPNGWAIFNDDLLLTDYRFKSLAEVIAQAGGLTPLTLKKAA